MNDPYLHGSRLPVPVRFSGYQSDVLCERAGEWLPAAGPWFAVVSLEAPHPPYTAPSAGVTAVDPAAVRLAANVPPGPAAARARRELAGYYAHLAATDRALAGLLAAAPADRTVVVFTSVHGDMHGAHGLFRKGWPQEESVRVPFLVRRPGEGARREARVVSLLDLPAMTRAWADGTSWSAGSDFRRISMPSVVALPDQCPRVWRGVRTPTRKLVLNADDSPWLFFDLGADPAELHNLAADPLRGGELAALRALV